MHHLRKRVQLLYWKWTMQHDLLTCVLQSAASSASEPWLWRVSRKWAAGHGWSWRPVWVNFLDLLPPGCCIFVSKIVLPFLQQLHYSDCAAWAVGPAHPLAETQIAHWYSVLCWSLHIRWKGPVMIAAQALIQSTSPHHQGHQLQAASNVTMEMTPWAATVLMSGQWSMEEAGCERYCSQIRNAAKLRKAIDCIALSF